MPKLPIVVDSDSPINIKAQIIGQVQLLIALNELRSGDTLPTVVGVAEHLGVNHNTVAAVYRDLIKSGYLIAQRGKGTFVSSKEIVKKSRGHQRIYALLAEANDLAIQFGLDAAEFGVAAYSQALLSSRTVATPPKVVFVATEQSGKILCKAISSEIGIPLSFLTWSKIKAKREKSLEELNTAKLVITIRQLFYSVAKSSAPDIEVFAINVQLNSELLKQLPSLPDRASVLLVGEEEAENEAIKLSLSEAGVDDLNLKAIDKKELQHNPEILKQAKLVIVSPTVENYVRRQLNIADRVMVFNFLDLENISLLKARLATIQSELRTVSI